MTHPLLRAAELVEAHMAALNDTKSQCECCGLTKYENWPEFQERTELAAVVRKLRRYYGAALATQKEGAA